MSHGSRRRCNNTAELPIERMLMFYDEILMKIPMQRDEYVYRWKIEIQI